jgi:hypothetical protein
MFLPGPPSLGGNFRMNFGFVYKSGLREYMLAVSGI